MLVTLHAGCSLLNRCVLPQTCMYASSPSLDAIHPLSTAYTDIDLEKLCVWILNSNTKLVRSMLGMSVQLVHSVYTYTQRTALPTAPAPTIPALAWSDSIALPPLHAIPIARFRPVPYSQDITAPKPGLADGLRVLNDMVLTVSHPLLLINQELMKLQLVRRCDGMGWDGMRCDACKAMRWDERRCDVM